MEKFLSKKKPVAEKKIAKKRETPIEEKNINYKYPLCKCPPVLTIFAYFHSFSINKFKNKYKCIFYQKEDPTNDYFYKIIDGLYKQHLEYLGEYPEMYNIPFDTMSFEFTPSSKRLRPTDKLYNTILAKDCIGHKVKLKLKLNGYDFMSGDKRKVGINIKVSEMMKL